MTPPTAPVLHLAEQVLQPRPPDIHPLGATAERIEMHRAPLGDALGLRHLGCSLVEVAPGKQAYPFHSHWHNDEVFVILAGEGDLRLGTAHHPLRSGDVVGCPAGGPDTAHAITNTGRVPLRYLALSSQHLPETCEYPDSGKTAFYDLRASATPGAAPQPFALVLRDGHEVPYWDGE